ncbi:MAG: hypothetical protein L0215_12190 [Gemmataceae bacterium]|nr:hypothetical protein [Gemmataceae bacterium]
MRRTFLAFSIVGLLTSFALAQDPLKSGSKPRPAENRDYSEFAKIIHAMVVKEIPKEYEDLSGWGLTIPFPDKVVFGGLKRVAVKVGDRVEVPHGLWKRFKVYMADPAKDLDIEVQHFSKVDDKTYRVEVEADALVVGEGRLAQWINGLEIIGLSAKGEALINIYVTCDVGVAIKFKGLLPDVIIEPKIAELKITLEDFKLHNVGPVQPGPRIQELGNDLRGAFNSLLKTMEPEIRQQANQAIATALKEGKGKLSASQLLKIPLPK